MNAKPEVLRDERSIGEWLHGELIDAYGYETESWAVERVHRIEDQLQEGRADEERFRTEILWAGAMNAFAVPGRYVYITRELLQRADGDAPVAFVLAHEIAHHDLGHTQIFSGWLGHLRGTPGSVLAASLLRLTEQRLFGPEREAEADAYALDLCLWAEYDGDRCLEAFDILEAHALDHGDLDAVFGPAPCEHADSVLERARRWGWQRLRSHPPIRERKAALAARLERHRQARLSAS